MKCGVLHAVSRGAAKMGSSYTNIQVNCDDQNSVKKALAQISHLPAYVSKQKNGWVSAFPSETEDQSDETMRRICGQLSGALKTGVIGITVHDSDIFLYALAENGQVVDEYNSCPGYFDGNDDTPSGGNVQKLLPYCKTGTTEEALKKLLASGGKGLDASMPTGDVGAMLKRQLVKASPWWAKPVVWGAVSVYQMARKGKETTAPTMTAPMPLEMMDMVWKGDKMATAMAEILAIDHDRMISGFEYIDEDDAAVGRGSLALVGDRNKRKEYETSEEDAAASADYLKEMTAPLNERPSLSAFLQIWHALFEAPPAQDEFKRLCVSNGLKFKQTSMNMMGLAPSPIFWTLTMESDQFKFRKFQMSALPKAGTVQCCSSEIRQMPEDNASSFAQEFDFALLQSSQVWGAPVTEGTDSKGMRYAIWKAKFAYVFLFQSPADELSAQCSIEIWWEPWSEPSPPAIAGCVKDWLYERHPDLF